VASPLGGATPIMPITRTGMLSSSRPLVYGAGRPHYTFSQPVRSTARFGFPMARNVLGWRRGAVSCQR